jgi:hypothetical protein
MKRVLLIYVLAMVACHRDAEAGPDSPQVALWRSSHPDNYVVSVCWTGFLTGCTVFAVSDGSVVAAQTQTTSSTAGSPLDPREQDEPIEALFSQLSAMQECKTRDVAYDETYGFVRSYYLDCGEEGWGQKVPCFAAHTNDLSACDGMQDYSAGRLH